MCSQTKRFLRFSCGFLTRHSATTFTWCSSTGWSRSAATCMTCPTRTRTKPSTRIPRAGSRAFSRGRTSKWWSLRVIRPTSSTKISRLGLRPLCSSRESLLRHLQALFRRRWRSRWRRQSMAGECKMFNCATRSHHLTNAFSFNPFD